MQRGKKEIKKILGNNDENKTREEKRKYQITMGKTKVERKRENKKGPRNEMKRKNVGEILLNGAENQAALKNGE